MRSYLKLVAESLILGFLLIPFALGFLGISLGVSLLDRLSLLKQNGQNHGVS